MTTGVDWATWAQTFERSLGVDAFVALFADGGQFCDPVTPWTTDVRAVAEQTERLFPDWRQRVDRIRGGEHWAVFEWTGTGTLHADGAAVTAVVVHGATVLDVDAAGKVLRWRDYLDTNEPLAQLRAAHGQEGQ